MEKIGIVVPVYNTEKYLNDCLESIHNQSYSDFECVLVDDCSTDNSAQICKDWVNRDSRFQFVTTAGTIGGASAARNAGIRECGTQFIAFVDADDTLDPYFLEKMYGKMCAENADISMCNILRGNNIEFPDWDECVYAGKDIWRAYTSTKIINRVWNKLYKRNVIEGIDFPEGRDYMEDACWTAHVLLRCTRIACIPSPLYHYRVGENSLSKRGKQNYDLLCGSFLNELEKTKILLDQLGNDPAELERLQLPVEKCIKRVLYSCADLDKYKVYPELKQIVELTSKMEMKFNNPFKKLIGLIINGKQYRDIRGKVAHFVIISAGFNINEKKQIINNLLRTDLLQ